MLLGVAESRAFMGWLVDDGTVRWAEDDHVQVRRHEIGIAVRSEERGVQIARGGHELSLAQRADGEQFPTRVGAEEFGPINLIRPVLTPLVTFRETVLFVLSEMLRTGAVWPRAEMQTYTAAKAAADAIVNSSH